MHLALEERKVSSSLDFLLNEADHMMCIGPWINQMFDEFRFKPHV